MLAIGFCDFDYRDVKSTTTEIVNSYRRITCLLVHAIGKGSSSRFVNNSFNIKASNLACIFGCLTLRVVEVRRHGNNCFFYFLTKKIFCSLLHLHQDLRRNLRRGHLVAIYFNPGVTIVCLNNFVWHHLNVFLHDIIVELASDQSLDGEKRVVRIGYSLAFSRLSN